MNFKFIPDNISLPKSSIAEYTGVANKDKEASLIGNVTSVAKVLFPFSFTEFWCTAFLLPCLVLELVAKGTIFLATMLISLSLNSSLNNLALP